MWMARETPRARAVVASRRHALDHVVLQPVLGKAHQRLRGQPDVTDRLDLQQAGDERLEVLERQVRDVAAGDDDVAHARGGAQVVEHGGLPVDRLELELQLGDGGRRVAHQVHAGAVPAVLGAGREQLGQHLGGVAVGEPLDGPHLVLVQRVAGRVRVARGRAGQPVGGDGQHVPAHRVGEHALPSRHLAGHHRVEHLRGQQQRHRGAAGLVGLDVGVERLVEEVAVDAAQLAQVLHAVDALPLGAAPLLLGDVGETGQPTPVGLDELPCRVLVGLFEHGAASQSQVAEFSATRVSLREDLRCFSANTLGSSATNE